jgi:hypothetical protein
MLCVPFFQELALCLKWLEPIIGLTGTGAVHLLLSRVYTHHLIYEVSDLSTLFAVLAVPGRWINVKTTRREGRSRADDDGGGLWQGRKCPEKMKLT